MMAVRHIEVIVLQLGKLDLASAAGKLMLTMLAAVAARLVGRTHTGRLGRAKARGKTLGCPTRTTDAERDDSGSA
jgi:DNA invertase Pin-like site-specific DNA recombinase